MIGLILLELKQFLEILLSSPKGKIIVCNIIDGIQHSLIETSFVVDVLTRASGIMALNGYSNSHEAINTFATIREREYENPLDDGNEPPEFRLGGLHGSFDGENSHDLTCVIRFSTVREIVKTENIESIKELDLRLTEPQEEAQIEPFINDWIRRWNENLTFNRRVQLDQSHTLGLPNSVVWFTTRVSLQKTFGTKRSNKAQLVRDSLGLVQHNQGDLLAALHFPSRLFSKIQSNRPTFFDGANHSRFRTWPDSQSARLNMAWGHTVDLAKVDAEAKVIDGCVERVTLPLSGLALERLGLDCELEFLGRVETNTNKGPVADRDFVHRLSAGISSTQPIEKLLGLLAQ